MIRILALFIALLGVVLVGSLIFDDKGYVFIEFSDWIIEMNVFSMAIMAILALVGVLLLSWLVQKVFVLFAGSRSWLGDWGSRRKKNAFTNGLIAMAENNYLEARKQLASIAQEDFDGLNLLAAAEAEMQLAQPQRARETWRLATTFPKSALAAYLSLIRDHLQHQQASDALAIIAQINDKQKNQPVVLRLWAQALAQAGKWQELQDRLKGWKKPLGEDYAFFMQQASKGNFAEIASKQGAQQLKESWLTLPKATRKDPAHQAAYVQQLLDQGMHQDAQQALVEYQKDTPQPLLLPLFRQLTLPNPATAIKKLESWLKHDDMNVELLSTLGHLAYHAKDYTLAEKALAKAIKLGNRQEDLRLMASIKEDQLDEHQALQLYKQSMLKG
jgi:HemY protein